MSKRIQSPLLSLVWRIHDFRNGETDYLLGKILTIIDSVVTPDKQNKAVKDVIKATWYERNYYWDELEPLLIQFRDKFCPKIEEGYEDGYKIQENTMKPSDKNFFPEE